MRPTCDRSFAEDLITGYLDGAINYGDRQQVQLHLWQCPACRRLLGDLRLLRTAMMGADREPIGRKLLVKTSAEFQTVTAPAARR